MKRIVLALTLWSMMAVGAYAQEVYQEIMRLSRQIAEDESKSIELRKIATFKQPTAGSRLTEPSPQLVS